MAKKIPAVKSNKLTFLPTSIINNSSFLSPSTPDEVGAVIDSLNNKKRKDNGVETTVNLVRYMS